MAWKPSEELEVAIEGGLVDLVGWIKNNPTGTAGEAQTKVRNWVAANTDYKESWADKFAVRVLDVSDGTWIGFRTDILAHAKATNEKIAGEIMNALIQELNTLRSEAEMLWDLLNPRLDEAPVDHTYNDERSVADDLTRGFFTEQRWGGTINGEFVTVRKPYQPTQVGHKVESRPQPLETI